jgi:hypothetical protein
MDLVPDPGWPRSTLERPVFSVVGRTYRFDDVVRAARAWGELDDLEWQTAEGSAALDQLVSERSALDESAVEAAAIAWRYERRLLAADELEAWLAHWELRPSDWLDYVRRRLARESHAGNLSEALVRYTPHAKRVEGALWAEAVCSGSLARWARQLAGRAAAAAALGRPQGDDPGALDEALAELSRRARSPEASEKLLLARQVDWLRVECEVLAFPDEGMAREAALCVREDGMSLAEVARHAGVALTKQSVLLEEVPPPLSERLLSAVPGDLVGPVAVGDGYVVAAVRDKRTPAIGDPVVQERLDEEIPRRAVETEVTNRVRWHERP